MWWEGFKMRSGFGKHACVFRTWEPLPPHSAGPRQLNSAPPPSGSSRGHHPRFMKWQSPGGAGAAGRVLGPYLVPFRALSSWWWLIIYTKWHIINTFDLHLLCGFNHISLFVLEVNRTLVGLLLGPGPEILPWVTPRLDVSGETSHSLEKL